MTYALHVIRSLHPQGITLRVLLCPAGIICPACIIMLCGYLRLLRREIPKMVACKNTFSGVSQTEFILSLSKGLGNDI